MLAFISVLQWHCIQTYTSPYKSPATGYLVVEGYITGNGPTSFRLTRTLALPGDSVIPVVTGADLQVEGDDHSIYPFTETGNGYYALPSVALSPAVQYRLRISDVNGKTYLSDYVPYKPTPPIDSINWISDATGVTIYANTHDPTANTRYYEWKYVETWELNSSEQSGWIWQGDSLALRTEAQQNFTCWHTDSSTAILVGTSAKLAQDVVYEQPVNFIPVNSEPLGIEYSILVSQYALTDSAYYYLTQMQANTEQLGSIMDPLPTQLVGNIHCLSDPAEPVMGYFSAGTIQQQRIFIQRSQVPAWLYFFECPFADRKTSYRVDSLQFYFGGGEFTPIDYNNTLDAVIYNYTDCIDCRARGGVTTKPAFWQ